MASAGTMPRTASGIWWRRSRGQFPRENCVVSEWLFLDHFHLEIASTEAEKLGGFDQVVSFLLCRVCCKDVETRIANGVKLVQLAGLRDVSVVHRWTARHKRA